MSPVSISLLWAVFASMLGRVKYGLGAKADENPFFRNALASLLSILKIDCSGFVRLLVYRATRGKVELPDGSQNQRAHCEELAREGVIREVDYTDAAQYMTPRRLFICFIKPFTHGCGKTGHVWLLLSRKGKAVTLESHGGKGVNSRPWNSPTLLKQVFSCFELPAAA